MAQNILLHIGTIPSAFLQKFIADNYPLLQAKGLIYPNDFHRWEMQESPAHNAFYYNFFDQEKTESNSRTTSIIRLRPLMKEGHTLCLSASFSYSHIDVLQKIQKYLAHHFPAAKQQVFLSISRQDHAIEAHYAGCSLVIPSFSLGKMQQHYFSNILGYPHYLTQLQTIFGKQSITLCVDDGSTASRRTILHTFLQTAEVDAGELVESTRELSLSSSPQGIPKEFFEFSRIYNHLFAPLPTVDILPWSTQLHRFTPESGYKYDGCSLLGPERRKNILRHYATSNEVLAKQLGMEYLFPNPDPEPNWKPFSGLTEELAFKVAAQLAPDFAKARMEECDLLPRYYQTPAIRVCHQALHDALNFVASLPPLQSRLAPAKLSVLTTTYNHAAFIEANIKGIIDQQVNFPIQHIIADDGSDDGTQEIILSYAEKYPHIVPIFQRNRSYGPGNVQTLFDIARSPYVALCDGDDYFTDPHKLQTQVDFLNANPDCALCFHPVRVTYEDDPTRERFYPPVEELPRGIRPFYYLSDLIKCNLIQTNSVMYRWRFANGLPEWFRPDLMPGDWYWHLLHAELGKIGFINKVMSVYRRHKSSIYYLAEVDRLKHRYTVGLKELEAFDVVNKHFNKKFESILLDLTNGVFADCLLYAEKTDDMSIIEELVEKYPHFGQHFLNSLKIVSGKKP